MMASMNPKSHVNTVLFLLLACVLSIWHATASAASSVCPVSRISIVNFRAQDEGTVTTSLIGSIVNKCDTPIGVQIKVIFYDETGGILRVEDMWPASIDNIPAHTDYPFQVRIGRVVGFKRVEVRVIETRTWRPH
jgi:hypothetical protein